MELLRYISLRTQALFRENPIEWWIKRRVEFPNLWRIALDILGIPATSTPSERLFSMAGEIYSSRRKCLHGDTVQAILNVGSWWGAEGLPGIPAPIVNNPKVNHSNQIRLPLVSVNAASGTSMNLDDGIEGDLVDEVLENAGGYDEEMDGNGWGDEILKNDCEGGDSGDIGGDV